MFATYRRRRGDLRRITERSSWRLRHYYGGENTIHNTGHLDVEVGPDGTVAAVWFRCMRLPFRVHAVGRSRATQARHDINLGRVDGVTVAYPNDPEYIAPVV